jgi:hypothetical protein
MGPVAARSFNTLYIALDIAWLVIFSVVLIRLRRSLALVVGLAAGVLYFVVDYGVFYMLLGTRVVEGADPFWFLLWLSFSYGITNFAWIWLVLDQDGHALEWSLLPILGWIGVAFVSQAFGGDFATVSCSRGTTVVHAVMAVIMVVGYLILIVRNVRAERMGWERVNMGLLLALGIGVQLAWEAVLLISSIRPTGLQPLIVNSLIETNLGMPYVYFIHRAVSSRFRPDLARMT